MLTLEESFGAIQHVVCHMGDRTEAAALDENGSFVERVRGLHDLAVGAEQCGAGQLLHDELEAHDAVVHIGERRPRETDHIHFNAAGLQVIKQRANEPSGVLVIESCPIDEIHAGDAQRLLLEKVLGVKHADMNNNVAEICMGSVLEAKAHPTMRLIMPAKASGGHRISKNKETPCVAGCGAKALDEESLLVSKHRFQALAAHVAGR